jgi:hypothetical protein
MLILMEIKEKIRKRFQFTPWYTSTSILLDEFTKPMQLDLWKSWEGYENPSINFHHQLKMNYNFNLNAKSGGLLKPFNRLSITLISVY